MHEMWDEYPRVKKELREVERIIIKNSKCRDKKIESSINELLEAGGKMMRPAFSIIAANFGKYEEERTRALSAVIEMFHMATLVHDDVIDDASLRRGIPTIQSKYGKEYAVYIGDYLFCLCFKVMAQTASLQTIQMDTLSMSRICLGEVEQLNSRFDVNVSVKNYLRRIRGKTAELFSLSLYIGAAENECPEKLAKKFWRIGYQIGMAFQIIDDVLDYTGVDEKIGKDCANDLKDGVFTLPVIYAMEKKPKDLMAIIQKSSYTEDEIKQIIQLTNKYEGIDKARQLAKKYTEKAYKLIQTLPENPYKDVLYNVTKQLLDRKY
ncbi:MAG: polyprenyl synthetase family protein [Cellulosilyticaceae bacterium]